ncbi:MAG: SDR family oxidoreductase [Candidatus Dormibacteria bacterium]
MKAGRVVVTGGGSGIGAALCRRFAADGAQVVVADRNPDSAGAVAREIGGLAVTADVTREPEVAALVERAFDHLGGVDLYCSNAGVAVGGGPEAADADWQRSWECHVMAHVYAARHLTPRMSAQGGGHILGTISAAGLLNHVLSAPYAATKAAGLSFFEWLAMSGPPEVSVSVLCPQGVRTPMLGIDPGGFLEDGALEPETVADRVVSGLASGRFLILPHPEVEGYFQRKANDYDRWLAGMRRLHDRVLAGATVRE